MVSSNNSSVSGWWVVFIFLAAIGLCVRHMVTFRSMTEEMMISRKEDRSAYATIDSIRGEYWFLRNFMYREYKCVYTVYKWSENSEFELKKNEYGRSAIQLGNNEPWAGDWSHTPLIKRSKSGSGLGEIEECLQKYWMFSALGFGSKFGTLRKAKKLSENNLYYDENSFLLLVDNESKTIETIGIYYLGGK